MKINIEKLTEEELKELHAQISNKLFGFWGAISELQDINKEERQLVNYITQKRQGAILRSPQVNALTEFGFKIVIHDHHDNLYISIINYHKPKKEDEYYGVEFDKQTNSLLLNDKNPLSNEDLQKIRDILEIQ